MEANFLIGTICHHSRMLLTYEIKTKKSARRLFEFVRINPIGKAMSERERVLSEVEMDGYELPKSTEVFYIKFKWFRIYIIPPIIGDRPKYNQQDLEDLKNNQNISK